jgi:predicted dehydrogenase
MTDWTRRRFIRTTGAGIVASAAPFLMTRAKAAPSERVRHAAIGMGGRGRSLAKGFASIRECEVAVVCDVDPERRALAVRELPDSNKVAECEDYRRIVDDKTIDTISIATCDHWHTPIALAGIVAGKHVYVEKPCSHNVIEGHLLTEAAKKYHRCVQHGTQSRGSSDVKAAIQFMREGGLGKVRMAKAINHQFRPPIGRAPETDPPPGVNYDLWLGPAPKRPFTRNRWHYNWHWFWDYGTGDMGNDGIHQVDVARWGLGVGFPNVLSASGGQLFYDDDHETPDTQVVTFEYDDCYLMYEMRLWTRYRLEGHENGNVFYGDNGTVEVGDKGCVAKLVGKEETQIKGPGSAGIIQNFIDAVRADDPGMLEAPIEEGAISAALCHLGNIATRLGCGQLKYDPVKRVVPGNSDATALLSREYRSGYELAYTG